MKGSAASPDRAASPRHSALYRALGSPWTWAAVAAAVRLAFLALGPGFDIQPASDSVDYHRLAAHLASGRGFTLGREDGLYPTTFRPPLLPMLVAPFYALFGPRHVVALLVEIALSALTVPVVYALGLALRGRSTALASAVAVAFWPTLLYFSTVLLSETPAILLTAVSLLLAVRLFARGGAPLALGAGVALGLDSLARPTALPLAAFLLAWLALAPRRALGVRAREAALTALGLVLTVLPWTLRNYAVSGAFIPITTGSGTSLYDSNNPLVTTDPRYRGGSLTLRSVSPYSAEFHGMSELAIDRHSAARGREFLLAHRDLWPKLACWKLARFFRPRAETPITGSGMPRGAPAERLARRLDPVALSYGLLLPFIVLFGGRVVWKGRTY